MRAQEGVGACERAVNTKFSFVRTPGVLGELRVPYLPCCGVSIPVSFFLEDSV